MSMTFDRREFVKVFSAACSMLGLRASAQDAPQAQGMARGALFLLRGDDP